MSKVIGIDLGTGNSCVAVMEGGKPTIIVNNEGGRTTPSVVGFLPNGERKVGSAAKRQAITNAKRTVSSIKRYMGEKYDNVTEEIKRSTFNVVEGTNGIPMVDIDGKKYTPQEISAAILQYLKKAAEDYLGQKVEDAVITVPAYFSDSQRMATKEAGKIAGLNVKRIINEPTAAALAYGLDKNASRSKVAVFDLGQGTFDISILELEDGVFEVLSTNGDTHLGGDDFDQKIIDYLSDEFEKVENVDIRKDPMALQRIKEAAEKAKIELSNQTVAEINLPYITAIDGIPKHIVQTITRAKFEELCDDLIKRAIEPCKKAIKDAKLSVSDINEVILVGGSTRIPKVQEAVKNYFKKEPNKTVSPDEAVAAGACIQGSVLAGETNDVVLLDVVPLNTGIATMGNVMTTVIEANTTIPVKKTQIFSTAEDNQPGVEIVVLQGNRPMAKDNRTLGVFHLDGIAPAPRGVPQIAVTFDIDANGILSVSALDKATGKEQHITIEQSSTLSKEEIERMKKEAEEFAEADKKAKEVADKINGADAFAFQVSKSLESFGDKVTEGEKKEIEPLIEALKKAATDKNLEEIEKAQKELQEKWFPIASRIYQESAPQAEATAEPEPEK